MESSLRRNPLGFAFVELVSVLALVCSGPAWAQTVAAAVPVSPAPKSAPTAPSKALLERAEVQKKLASLKSEAVKLQQSVGGASMTDVQATRAAQSAMSRGDFIEAIAVLSAPAQKGATGPAQDDLRLSLGKALVDAGMDAEAIELLKPLAERPNLKDTATGLANYHLLRLYYRNGDYPNAVAAYLRTRDRLPLAELTHALYLAGNSYLRMKDHMRAVQALDKVPPESEYFPFALYSSGLAYLSIGDAYSSTLLRFQALVELQQQANPTVRQLIDRTHVTLGYFFVDQKRFGEAIEEFRKVEPESLYADQARFGLGWAYLGMGECVKSIVMFDELTQRYTVSPYAREGWLNIGACYSKLNAYNKAVDSYRDALDAYSAHRKVLKAVAEKVRSRNVSEWLRPPQTMPEGRDAPLPAGGKTPVAPAALTLPKDDESWVWRDLLANREVLDLTELYNDARRTEQVLASRAQSASESMAPAWKVRLGQAQAIRQDIERIIRQYVLEMIETSTQNVEDLALQANIGIAKNISVLVDNETR